MDNEEKKDVINEKNAAGFSESIDYEALLGQLREINRELDNVEDLERNADRGSKGFFARFFS